ncbi:glycosyltransferase [Ligilactobacillus apodemi DSM 16634 = JCM 16172]|uniref:Glycosyltransferase n=1 Tax=Ligilactobacillus apodemi DSM 16634 = JCM 16172 TaxID=1423724 RepID=A0A0R1U272_9LACO|nr:glycosyltransferase [Ligilactobacillus apodemi DSM 16634 = JCM 16172]
MHAGAEMYGADKILLELVTNLDKTKFRPIVILPTEGILVDKLKSRGIETYVVEYPILRRKYFNIHGIFKYLTSYVGSSKKIIKLLQNKNIDIDIIHVNTTAVLEGIYLKRKLGAKLLWHVHEIILKPKIIYKFISYLVGKYADQCIVVSKAVADHLIKSKMVSPQKIKVIYNGIDSKLFNPNTPCEYLAQEWDVPKNVIKIGMIGRVNAWKGQDDFLKATVPLLEKYPNLYLFIIGSAFDGQEWRVEKLKEKIASQSNCERIIFSEFRKDNAAIHNFFDVLLLPSINPDPLPTVVLEAMASGKPVIGYNHGGVTEMVVNGENGLLAKVKDPSDMSKKLDKLISSEGERIRMGKASRSRQVKYFSLESFIKNFEKQYDLL